MDEQTINTFIDELTKKIKDATELMYNLETMRENKRSALVGRCFYDDVDDKYYRVLEIESGHNPAGWLDTVCITCDKTRTPVELRKIYIRSDRVENMRNCSKGEFISMVNSMVRVATA